MVLGAGWGATTKVVTAGSTDHGGELVITGVTGGGLAQATATVAFTFKDGAFARAPSFIVTSTASAPLTEVGGWAQSNTTTVGTWTYGVLPVNAVIYRIRWICVAGYA
jgi:hypothetical protein